MFCVQHQLICDKHQTGFVKNKNWVSPMRVQDRPWWVQHVSDTNLGVSNAGDGGCGGRAFANANTRQVGVGRLVFPTPIWVCRPPNHLCPTPNRVCLKRNLVESKACPTPIRVCPTQVTVAVGDVRLEVAAVSMPNGSLVGAWASHRSYLSHSLSSLSLSLL